MKRSRPTNLKLGTGSAKKASIIPAPPTAGSLRRYAIPAFMVMVLLYAALSGLRTVTNPDTGWQLATGKYILEHHQIPSTDVLSYTVRGQKWIYPPFSQLFLYALYSLGGFAALSWLNAAACAGTVWATFSAIDSNGRTIWIADAHRGGGKRFVVHAEEKLTGSALAANDQGASALMKPSVRGNAVFSPFFFLLDTASAFLAKKAHNGWK